jgi:hypothetical protein
MARAQKAGITAGLSFGALFSGLPHDKPDLAPNLLAVMSNAARDLSDLGAVRRERFLTEFILSIAEGFEVTCEFCKPELTVKPLPSAAEVWTTDPGLAISESRDGRLG